MTADMASPSGVGQLGDFVARLPGGALPDAVHRMVQRAIVDTVGGALGGLSVDTVPPLTDFLEEYFRRAMLVSRGDLAIFVERPISATVLALTVVIILARLAQAWRAAIVQQKCSRS